MCRYVINVAHIHTHIQCVRLLMNERRTLWKMGSKVSALCVVSHLCWKHYPKQKRAALKDFVLEENSVNLTELIQHKSDEIKFSRDQLKSLCWQLRANRRKYFWWKIFDCSLKFDLVANFGWILAFVLETNFGIMDL
jgi:hypothetical protein